MPPRNASTRSADLSGEFELKNPIRPGLLLHVRRERPYRRATDETDKFPPPHCLASGPRGNSGSLVRHSKAKSSTSAMGHVWTAPLARTF